MVVRDAILKRYGPAECRAIATHKYFLGLERGYDPPIAEAVESWEHRYAYHWRSEKIRRDMADQTYAIECFRCSLCGEWGHEVTFAEAAREWVRERGDLWRTEREADARFDPGA